MPVLHACSCVTKIKALFSVHHLWSEGSWHHSAPLQICSSLLSCNLHPGPVSLLLQRECAKPASNMPRELVQRDLQPGCLDPVGTFGMSSPSTILVSSLLASWETFISSLPFKSQHKVKSSPALTTFPLSCKICISERRDSCITRTEFRQSRCAQFQKQFQCNPPPPLIPSTSLL